MLPTMIYGAQRAEPMVPLENTLLRQGFGGLSATSDIRRLSDACLT